MLYLKTIAKKLTKGVLLQISLTYRCSGACDICCQKFLLGRHPKVKETNFLGWVRFFKRFPYKIKEVYVSGGEPVLHPDFVRIVNYLLCCGYYVRIFTNLKDIRKFYAINQSYKLSIKATYHHNELSSFEFDENYQRLKNIHSVEVDEIEYPQMLPYSKMQSMLHNDHSRATGENFYEATCLRISPDLHINLNCYELVSNH
jgi:MoaA/NifB/PqqE/SkfB family radical SAM enzyme